MLVKNWVLNDYWLGQLLPPGTSDVVYNLNGGANDLSLYGQPYQDNSQVKRECLYHIGSIRCLPSLHSWPLGQLLLECDSQSQPIGY